MISKTVLDLVNKDVDGVASPKERAKLKKLLDTDQEVAKVYADLRSLADAFDRVQPVEPPPSLKAAILRNAEQTARSVHSPMPSRFRRAIHPVFTLSQSLVFGAGILAGVLLLAGGEMLFRTQGEGNADLTGTIATHSVTAVPTGPALFAVRQGSVEAMITLSREGDHSTVGVSIERGRLVQTELSYDAASLKVVGIHSAHGTLASLSMGQGSLLIGGQGQTQFDVTLQRMASGIPPVRVRLKDSDGNIVCDRVLSLQPGEN
jgi:hypothetical protein